MIFNSREPEFHYLLYKLRSIVVKRVYNYLGYLGKRYVSVDPGDS